MSNTLAIDDPKIVEGMQDDIVALVQAWADRGISPAEAAQMFAAVGHHMLARFGYKRDELVDLLKRNWDSYVGTI